MSDQNLIETLSDWLVADQGPKTSLKLRESIRIKATKVIEIGSRNKSLRVLRKNQIPLAILARIPAFNPRVRNQQALVFFHDKNSSGDVIKWIRRQLGEVGRLAPRFTGVGLSTTQDKLYGKCLTHAGFLTRYEVLKGNTRIALENLIRVKNPLDNLNHLDLDIRQVTSKSEIPEVIKFQKYIAQKFRSHGYFSHTPAQLESDRLEYLRMISKKSGMILGVYHEDKLRGFMVAGIHDNPDEGKIGGMAFFLHPSIQGLGISKTGYLLLLKYLLKNKVKTFWGGTSQPAIKGLGNVMKRETEIVLYVKMKRDS